MVITGLFFISGLAIAWSDHLKLNGLVLTTLASLKFVANLPPDRSPA
ncbi:hypothetical protein DMTZ50_0464 [Dehalococcoides mccartyi]|nr:hypothetical protein [Dehalococcoides mccartyi]